MYDRKSYHKILPYVKLTEGSINAGKAYVASLSDGQLSTILYSLKSIKLFKKSKKEYKEGIE